MVDLAGPPRGEARPEIDAPARDVRKVGFAAGSVALAFLWVISGLGEGVPFPPTALAEAIIRATPGDIATFFIELLKGWARRGLAVSATVASLVLAAQMLAWTMQRTRIRPAAAGAVLAAAAFVAILPAPSISTNLLLAALALGAAALVYALTAAAVAAGIGLGPGALGSAGPQTEGRADEAEPAGFDPSRRRVLKLGAGTATAIALGGGVVGYFLRKVGGPNRNVELIAPQNPATLPEGEWPDIPGLSPEITSAADHYVVDINLVQPSLEAQEWRLGVGGEVAAPLELNFMELQERFEIVEEYSVLTCISNEVGGGLVGNSRWAGVRLADVLEAAEARAAPSGPTDVIFTAADGYSDSITLEAALDPAVLLAVAQNGEPLMQEHGFPCRVRVPSTFGMKNVKWLTSIEVAHRDYKGYWMQRGWSDLALVKTGSRIDVAGGAERSAVPGEPTWIAGVAWAGNRGISRVEVSTDGGQTWARATLKEAINSQTWRLWAYRWTPEGSGSAVVLCRAVDGDGTLQERGLADPHPSGATGYHTVEVGVA
ncbi:MAG: molybdopterin-dependent oxidoreductase [Actinobacteria bacterium]|nr:molybdopterin-dependent oxidoreductase [Actinomycetota bacterium]